MYLTFLPQPWSSSPACGWPVEHGGWRTACPLLPRCRELAVTAPASRPHARAHLATSDDLNTSGPASRPSQCKSRVSRSSNVTLPAEHLPLPVAPPNPHTCTLYTPLFGHRFPSLPPSNLLCQSDGAPALSCRPHPLAPTNLASPLYPQSDTYRTCFHAGPPTPVAPPSERPTCRARQDPQVPSQVLPAASVAACPSAPNRRCFDPSHSLPGNWQLLPMFFAEPCLSVFHPSLRE